MVTGLYAALAASASVFIGILTALLTSNLSNLKSERDRIEHRTEKINARIGALKQRKKEFQEKIDEIKQQREDNTKYNEAYDEISDFIYDHVGLDFYPELSELTEELVQEELKNFLDKESLNDYHHDILQERWKDIKSELNPDLSVGLQPSPEFVAADKQSAAQWRMQQDSILNQNKHHIIQTNTEIKFLKEERHKLENRYKTLSPSHIIEMLHVCVGTIILSVGIPLIAYLFRTTDTQIATAPRWFEPTLVFIVWLVGLGIVFIYLHFQFNSDTDALPVKIEDSGKVENNRR